MKEVLIRAARTFAQATLTIYLAGLTAGSTGLSSFADVDLLDSAIAGGGAALLAFLLSWLEETRNVTYNRG